MLSDTDIKNLEKLCKENRKNILKMVYHAQSGHIGGGWGGGWCYVCC